MAKKKATRKAVRKTTKKVAKKKTAKKKRATKKVKKRTTKKKAKKRKAKKKAKKVDVVGLPAWLAALLKDRDYEGQRLSPQGRAKREELLSRYAALGYRDPRVGRALLEFDRRLGFDPLDRLKQVVAETATHPAHNWWAGSVGLTVNGERHTISYPGIRGYAIDGEYVDPERPNDAFSLLTAVVDLADGYPVVEDVAYERRKLRPQDITIPVGSRGAYGTSSKFGAKKEEKRVHVEEEDLGRTRVVKKMIEAESAERRGEWQKALSAYESAASMGAEVERGKIEHMRKLTEEEEEWQAWRAGVDVPSTPNPRW